MASNSIKVRAKAADGVTTVKALMTHEMETGLRKKKETGEVIPAHFIQEVTAKWNGKVVMTAYWGGAISKNPYLSFKFKGGNAGEDLELSWVDNTGDTDSLVAKID